MRTLAFSIGWGTVGGELETAAPWFSDPVLGGRVQPAHPSFLIGEEGPGQREDLDFWGPYSGPSRRGSSQCPPSWIVCQAPGRACFSGECRPTISPLLPSPLLHPVCPPPPPNKSQSQIIFSSALFWGRMGGHAGKGLIPVAESSGLVGTLSAAQHSLWGGLTCPQSLWEPPVLSVLGGGLGALSVLWSQGDSQGCKPGKYWCYGTFHGAHCPGKSRVRVRVRQ